MAGGRWRILELRVFSHNTPLFWQVDLASRTKFQSRLVLQRNPLYYTVQQKLGDARSEMPPKPPTASSENISSSASAEPSLAGAPATSPPAVDFQPPISFLELNADTLELLELAKVLIQAWQKELELRSVGGSSAI